MFSAPNDYFIAFSKIINDETTEIISEIVVRPCPFISPAM